MKYLNTRPGSIEEIAANMSKHTMESGYQDMFKKELEKAGKGIGAMTPAEKKAFFNKIDTKYKAKNENVSDKQLDTFHKKLDNLVHKTIGKSSDEKKEAVDNPYAVGMAQAMKSTGDKPPLKKSTITKAHDIAKSIAKDEKNEEKDVPKGYHKMPDGTVMKDSEHKKETHSFMTKDMNKSKKDAKGEKEIVDPAPKIVQEAIDSQVYSLVRKYQNKEKPIEFTKDLSKVLDNMKRKVNNLNSFKKEMQIKTADREMVIDEIRRMIEIQRMKFDNPAGKPIYNIMLKMTTDVNGISQELDEKEPNSNLIKKYLNNVIGLHKRLQISLRNVKETVDPKPKMSFKEAYKKVKEAMNTVGDATADQANQRAGEGTKENDPDIKKPKAKADTGSKATPIDTSPEVEYKN